jgi:hypothetical protein
MHDCEVRISLFGIMNAPVKTQSVHPEISIMLHYLDASLFFKSTSK